MIHIHGGKQRGESDGNHKAQPADKAEKALGF